MYRACFTCDIGILLFDILYFTFNKDAETILPHFACFQKFQGHGSKHHLSLFEKK